MERGRPAHPQDNGGHERLHRDIAEELENLGQGATPEALELWREEFNRERPHEALGMRCPAELYRDSSRPYRAAEVQLSYPAFEQIREQVQFLRIVIPAARASGHQ